MQFLQCHIQTSAFLAVIFLPDIRLCDKLAVFLANTPLVRELHLPREINEFFAKFILDRELCPQLPKDE